MIKKTKEELNLEIEYLLIENRRLQSALHAIALRGFRDAGDNFSIAFNALRGETLSPLFKEDAAKGKALYEEINSVKGRKPIKHSQKRAKGEGSLSVWKGATS